MGSAHYADRSQVQNANINSSSYFNLGINNTCQHTQFWFGFLRTIFWTVQNRDFGFGPSLGNVSKALQKFYSCHIDLKQTREKQEKREHILCNYVPLSSRALRGHLPLCSVVDKCPQETFKENKLYIYEG